MPQTTRGSLSLPLVGSTTVSAPASMLDRRSCAPTDRARGEPSTCCLPVILRSSMKSSRSRMAMNRYARPDVAGRARFSRDSRWLSRQPLITPYFFLELRRPPTLLIPHRFVERINRSPCRIFMRERSSFFLRVCNAFLCCCCRCLRRFRLPLTKSQAVGRCCLSSTAPWCWERSGTAVTTLSSPVRDAP